MEKNFALTPTVSISRSKFLRTSQHKTSINLGDIVPVYVDEVLPGDTRNFSIASLIRMSTPIAPIMDDIVMEYFAFFVPNRLVWNHWKEFMGESDTAGFDTETEYVVPQDEIDAFPENGLYKVALPGSVYDYMGIPQTGGATTKLKVSALPMRAYLSIYNRWFRNQNVEGPVYFATGDNGCKDDPYVIDGVTYAEKTAIGSTVNIGHLKPLVAYKKADYFTSSLPYAQKGLPVALPLGTFAPVITRGVDVSAWADMDKEGGVTSQDIDNYSLHFRKLESGDPSFDVITGSGGNLSFAAQSLGPSNLSADFDGQYGDPTVGIAPTNLWADLSNATAATINDIRLAFATQKALEKDALYGTRYWEILYGHFGVKSPDASLQDPEYLGGSKVYINVDQVLQTTGYASSSSSGLGAVGANSVTGSNSSLFTKSFVEHGHIIVCAVARQKQHTYGQGLNRMWSRNRRFDFYLPVFANLGAQEVKKKEIFIDGVNDESLFGFQEAWAEYRFKPSIATGVLNPAGYLSLDFWTLTDKYSECPTLSKSFLKETRANLSRALVTGVSGPDFICDFLFNDIAVRPMPLYSIPGLIDHH